MSWRVHQVVIEGVRGPSYISDAAIDDVAIERGEACRRQEALSTSFATPAEGETSTDKK